MYFKFKNGYNGNVKPEWVDRCATFFLLKLKINSSIRFIYRLRIYGSVKSVTLR